MATTELTRAETASLATRVGSLTRRLSGLKDRTEREAGRIQSTMVSAGSGFVLGMLEARAATRSEAMATIMGLDHQLVYGGVLLAVGMFASGRMSEVAHDAADGILSIYAYKVGGEQGRRP